MGGLHDIKKKDWERLLKKNGFYLDRTGKHQVWKHPDGRTIPVSSQGINPCIARRMIKENRLEGAPYGWSERANKQEAKTTTQWQEQLKKAQEKLQVQEQEQICIEQPLPAEEHRNIPTTTPEATATPIQEPETPMAPAEQKEETNATTPKTNLYMNDQRLKKFHEYLCAVVEYYQKNKSLKNFSTLAKQFQVKAITQELFYQSKLDELKPGQKPDRQTSDKIRLMMAEEELKRRQQMLNTFLKAQEQKDGEGNQEEAVTKKEPTLTERIDTFEARFDLLGPVFANITSQVYEHFRKEFGNSTSNLLGMESNFVRLDPYPYLKEWADGVEFDLTRLVFDKATPEDVRKLLPSWNEKITHAYLTWLYGGKDGDQLKMDFDERGCADSSNEQLIDLLRDQQLLDDMLFVKLESWKGSALCAAIYKDAPDVLMIINDTSVNFYTIEDNIWHSFSGDSIINPETNLGFGGYGTRTLVGYCLHQLLNDDNHKAAVKEQQNVTKLMRGKMMDDINHYRDIWQMYHEEWEQGRRDTMLDFG